MPEPYTVLEMMTLHSSPTMPQPSQVPQPVWLHAASDDENGEATVACTYLVVSDKDLLKRDLAFSNNWTPKMYAPKCPACIAQIEATV
jgi:hypothetical protein